MLFSRAILSNQLVRFAPDLYVRLTGQTGRGSEEATPQEVAEYFMRCVEDYREQLGLAGQAFDDFLRGSFVLEYGPGDILGIALLLYAHGAERVTCVDRFALSRMTPKSIAVYECLLESLDLPERKRAEGAFRGRGKPASGFNGSAISYEVTESGLSRRSGAYDLVISRAVLEHVNDLAATMFDICRSLKPDGVSIHQVDLKSHGLDRDTDFDFLTWPDAAYKLMYSHKGFPNRWRVDRYRELASALKLRIRQLKPTGQLPEDKLNIVLPRFARGLTRATPDELAWTGFWMVLEKR